MITIEKTINKEKMAEAYKNSNDKFEILVPDGSSNLEYISHVETSTEINFKIAAFLGLIDVVLIPVYFFLLYSAFSENRAIDLVLVALVTIRFFAQSSKIHNLRGMIITNEWERHMNHVKSFLIKSSMKMILTNNPKSEDGKEYLTEEEFSGIIEKSERMTNTLMNFTTSSIVDLKTKDKKL